ncbi:MAG: hypothetical protein R3B13_04715 [Polyangiaceae bacterium]
MKRVALGLSLVLLVGCGSDDSGGSGGAAGAGASGGSGASGGGAAAGSGGGGAGTSGSAGGGAGGLAGSAGNAGTAGGSGNGGTSGGGSGGQGSGGTGAGGTGGSGTGGGSGFVPAYPGQAAPGMLLWGAAVQGNADPASRHEIPAGHVLTVHRTFFQWAQRTTSMITMAKGDIQNKRVPWVSVKTPSWDAMGKGQHDAEIDQMLKALDAIQGPIWLTIHHEPEGGGASGNTPDDPAGPAGHVAMNKRVRERMTALKVDNIALAPILMSYTWNPASGRNPDAWYAPEIYDFVGIDHYRDAEASLLTNVWATVRTWASKRQMDIAIGEWGVRGTNQAAGQRVHEWYDHAAGSNKDGKGARVVGLAAFDSGLNSPSGSWELTGEQLKAFQALLNDPRTATVVP